ncbi:MAG: endonuclease domain-containing protein [Bacteroidaceae bacterium]|nr:endonuclease domain-containing protein [Bacteroidaceae bacterium]
MDYRTASPDRYLRLKEFAKENRRNMTLAETVLWEELRKLEVGTRFNRQHIVGDYIVDFISQREGLIIEVDGGYHAERQQQEDDALREQCLEQMGFHVMRFTNEEVLYDTDNVLSQIESYFE